MSGFLCRVFVRCLCSGVVTAMDGENVVNAWNRQPPRQFILYQAVALGFILAANAANTCRELNAIARPIRHSALVYWRNERERLLQVCRDICHTWDTEVRLERFTTNIWHQYHDEEVMEVARLRQLILLLRAGLERTIPDWLLHPDNQHLVESFRRAMNM